MTLRFEDLRVGDLIFSEQLDAVWRIDGERTKDPVTGRYAFSCECLVMRGEVRNLSTHGSLTRTGSPWDYLRKLTMEEITAYYLIKGIKLK
jgi:hypothetical protein